MRDPLIFQIVDLCWLRVCIPKLICGLHRTSMVGSYMCLKRQKVKLGIHVNKAHWRLEKASHKNEKMEKCYTKKKIGDKNPEVSVVLCVP